MLTFLLILIILASVLLILVVLIQNPKGGGLASNFSSSNQIMGVKKTGDIVEKATWILAVVVICLSVSTNFFREGDGGSAGTSRIQNKVDEAPMTAPTNTPPPPTQNQQPGQQPTGDPNQPQNPPPNPQNPQNQKPQDPNQQHQDTYVDSAGVVRHR